MKWYFAIQRGDAKKAIYWAKWREKYEYKNEARFHTGPEPVKVDVTFLVYAYELNGEYEKALERLNGEDNGCEPDVTNGHRARLLYKLGQHEEAFKSYYLVLQFTIQRMKRKKVDDDAIRKSLREWKMCSDPDLLRQLNPFEYSSDFRNFMRKTYQTIPDREQYDDVFELL